MGTLQPRFTEEVHYSVSPEEFRAQFEFDPIEDRQMSAAVDALRGVAAVAKLGGFADAAGGRK